MHNPPCSVCLSLALYFSLSASSTSILFPSLCRSLSLSISFSLRPTVSIQWMERRFFIFSLHSLAQLSGTWSESEAAKSERSLPRAPKWLWKTHTVHKWSHTHIHTLQVQALVSWSGRKEIRGLLPVVVLIKRCWIGYASCWGDLRREGHKAQQQYD